MPTPPRFHLLLCTHLSMVGLAACHSHPGDHDHDEAGHGDHGHAEEDPRPDLSWTVYESGLELFMEAPAFVVGQTSPLIAHFTDAHNAESFVWVTEGKVTATLRYADGTESTFVADRLLRNGIFKPLVVPTQAGVATLSLTLEGPVSGTVSVGEVRVFPDVAGAVASVGLEEPGEPELSYLKEAQWKTTYATALAETAPIRGSVRAAGELVAPYGARAALTSPLEGRLVAGTSLRVGSTVQAGEMLARIVGLGDADRASVEAELAAADAEFALADAAARRAESLHPAVVSDRELEAARQAATVARKRRDMAQGRRRAWSGSSGPGAEVRSPIAGVVAFVRAEPGAVVAAGAPLVEVVDTQTLWLQARVYEMDAARIRGTPGAMFTLPGRENPVIVDAEHGGTTISVGPAVDPIDRTVPVLYSFPNPGDLLPGSQADVRVFTAETTDAIVVPREAVVDDNGTPVVFVMSGGESFFKRRVTLGEHDGERVAVLTGIAPGERVVSRGAYEILLSTAEGGIPAHGHQH